MSLYTCNEKEYNDLKNGKSISVSNLQNNTFYKVKFENEIISISYGNNNTLKSIKWFNKYIFK